MLYQSAEPRHTVIGKQKWLRRPWEWFKLICRSPHLQWTKSIHMIAPAALLGSFIKTYRIFHRFFVVPLTEFAPGHLPLFPCHHSGLALLSPSGKFSGLNSFLSKLSFTEIAFNPLCSAWRSLVSYSWPPPSIPVIPWLLKFILWLLSSIPDETSIDNPPVHKLWSIDSGPIWLAVLKYLPFHSSSGTLLFIWSLDSCFPKLNWIWCLLKSTKINSVREQNPMCLQTDTVWTATAHSTACAKTLAGTKLRQNHVFINNWTG